MSEREKAIDVIESIMHKYEEDEHIMLGDEEYKALRFARDSLRVDEAYQLEYESTTKTCKTCRNYGSHNGVCDICKDYNCFTEPKTGHWIYHREEDFKCCEHWECSNCHKSTMTNPMSEKNDYNHMYYCPKCGMKMVELQESDGKEL